MKKIPNACFYTKINDSFAFMELDNKSTTERPVLADFDEPVDFLRAMIEYLKAVDPSFTIVKATKNLRKVSPALVTLVMQKKRQLTLDRIEEFSKLFRLTVSEKTYLRLWIEKRQNPEENKEGKPGLQKNRKEVSEHILKDWINVYVKDCFQIPEVQSQPELVYRQLANIAQPHRIGKAIEFLLQEGHLRKTLDGKIVTETPLTVTDPQVSMEKIRKFHIGALSVAKAALESHPVSERYANTFIMPLDEKQYQELIQLIQEFAEKMKDFASQSSGPRLYQLIINASPTGGKFV